jgi:MFS family permease
MNNVSVFWFYFGTLISSIGSFVFNICLVAFMLQTGYDLFQVSLILGLQRLVPVFAAGLLGHYTDKFSPRLTVVLTEAGAALATFGILWAWKEGSDGYWLLLAFTLLKTSFVSFQAGSKVKITKILCDPTYASSANHAIWFNKATQGATLFAGVVAWPIITNLNFETAISLDLLTFIVNGVIVFLLPLKDPTKEDSQSLAIGIFAKFTDFYKYNRRAAVLDFLLAISMMGTTSFTSRLAGSDQKWMAVFIGGYGLSVWLAGFIEKSQILKNRSLTFWLGLGLSYSFLGFFPQQGLITLALVICKDTFYWLLLHRISSHIQMDTPQEVMGSVSSARTTQMIMILATGELLVGTWSKVLPVAYDGLWRGIFCILVMALMGIPRFQAKAKHGYAKL